MPEIDITAPVPAPAEPAPDAPTNAELYSTLEQERISRMNAEQRAQNAEAAMYTQRPNPQPQQPQDNSLDGVVSNFITDPQGAARNLQGYIQNASRGEARQAAAQAAAMTEQRMRAEMENNRMQGIISAAQAQYPEFRDTAKFAGAIAEARVSAENQGLRLTPEQMVERAARVIRAGRPAQPAPFVEGSGSGAPVGSPSNTPQVPLEQNMLEELYGADAGEIIPINAVNMTEYTARVVLAENADRVKHGITPSGTVVQPKERKRASA